VRFNFDATTVSPTQNYIPSKLFPILRVRIGIKLLRN
jgi:hypothetical protein